MMMFEDCCTIVAAESAEAISPRGDIFRGQLGAAKEGLI